MGQHVVIAPCAGTSFCCGWCYAFWVLLTSGTLIMVAVPLGSACYVLDDINGDLLTSVLQALGDPTNEDSTNFKNVIGLIDGCLAGNAPTGELADILLLEQDGVTETVRQ